MLNFPKVIFNLKYIIKTSACENFYIETFDMACLYANNPIITSQLTNLLK